MLTPYEDVQAMVLGAVSRLPVVTVPAADAVGLVVAGAVAAPEDVPPFPNSAMDGFAVRAADTAGASDEEPVELRVAATLAAGADPTGVTVGPGEAVRIMTGAAFPDGADAVVIVEQTEPAGDDRVRVRAEAKPGDHIRPAGDDMAGGATAIPQGTVLTAAHLGVLASIGVAEVDVVRRVRVGVLSTGDELVEGTGPLRPGQIRESNRRALVPLVTETGATAIDLGLVRDDEAAIAAAIERAAAECDALLTTGGVSMGDFDFVKAVLDRLAPDMRWLQVAIRPAKPFAFGTLEGPDGRRVPVFGLPGNPVSSIVSFELFARPAIRRMMGRPPDDVHRLTVRATADEGLPRRPDGKVHLVRVVATYDPDEGWYRVRSAGGQGSHQLRALAAANALAVLPDGSGASAGDEVEAMILGEVRNR